MPSIHQDKYETSYFGYCEGSAYKAANCMGRDALVRSKSNRSKDAIVKAFEDGLLRESFVGQPSDELKLTKAPLGD